MASHLISCHVHEVGSFQHQQPGLLNLHARLGNVCQDCALLYQGLPEGHPRLHLWTQETRLEKWGSCPAGQVGEATKERAGSRSSGKQASGFASSLAINSFQGEGPDADNIHGCCRAGQRVAAQDTCRNPFTPAIPLPLGCQAGTDLLDLSQHLSHCNAGSSHRRGEGALC